VGLDWMVYNPASGRRYASCGKDGFVMAETKLLDNLLKACDLPEEVTPSYVMDAGFLKEYPAVSEVLYSRESGNGHRLPAKLSLFMDQNSLKVCVMLPSECLMAFLTLSDPKRLWELLETKIANDELEWREDKRARKPR